MSARKSVYAITDIPCDGGESPNAYVARITAEVRVHFPPNTVNNDQAQAALLASYSKASSQIHAHFARCCPGHGSMAHVRGCANHPEVSA